MVLPPIVVIAMATESWYPPSIKQPCLGFIHPGLTLPIILGDVSRGSQALDIWFSPFQIAKQGWERKWVCLDVVGRHSAECLVLL